MTGRTLIGLCAVVVPLTVLPVEALAINRYTSTSMTCSGVTAALNRDGAAILRYTSKSGALLYDRYVKNRNFCQPDETTQRAYIPSSDLPACPVYRCKQIEFLDYR
ncbi:MAG: hypothetical protein JNK47_20010 [Mesorhizobium sp.]|nr:hypothetical protein [Mesorhizobium sp.]